MWTFSCILCLSCVALAVCRPPKITKNPESLQIYEQGTRNLQMDCVADGEPAVTYTWQKNGQEFSLNRKAVKSLQGNGSFIFKVLNYADAGYYQCFAQNLYGKAMSQISSVQQAVMSSFPTRPEPLKYEVNQGDKLMVLCYSPKSYPEPVYSWAIADNTDDKNPDEITQDKRILIDLNGDLHFANVEPYDYQGGRIYMCRAYNPYLRTLKAGSESKIIVNTGSPSSSRPMLEFHPSQSEVVVAGQTMTFQCIFSGFPTPNVKFSRVGGAMPFERYKSLKHGTVMQITNVTDADEGQYKCTGSNSDINGENSFEFIVDVEVIPVFETTDNRPHNVNKIEGESVSFLCNPKAEPEASIQWFMNGDPIDFNSPGPRMRITENNRNLTIIDLCKTCRNGKTDLQVIQCNASNVHGYAFAQGYVNVFVRTSNVRKCGLVSQAPAGCGGVDIGPNDEKIKLTVWPKNISMESWEDEVIFECDADGDDVTWLFNDIAVDTNNTVYEIVDGHNLKIDPVLLTNQDKKAEGKYTCKATDGKSIGIADAYLTIPNDPTQKLMPQPPTPTSTQSDIIVIIIVTSVLAVSVVVVLLIMVLRKRQEQRESSNSKHPAIPPLEGSPGNRDANYEYIDTTGMSDLHQYRGDDKSTYQEIGPISPEGESTYTILNAST